MGTTAPLGEWLGSKSVWRRIEKESGARIFREVNTCGIYQGRLGEVGARLLLACMAIMMTSCAALTPLALAPETALPDSRPPLSTTAVEFSKANYHIVRANVSGHSNGFKLLGLFTIIPATRTKAFTQMYKNSHIVMEGPLTPAHIVIEQTDNSFVLFSIPQVFVRADFVIFDKPSINTPEKNLN